MNNNDRVTNYILILYYHRRKKKKKSIFDHNYFNLRPPPSTGPNIHAHTFFFLNRTIYYHLGTEIRVGTSDVSIGISGRWLENTK